MAHMHGYEYNWAHIHPVKYAQMHTNMHCANA